MQSPKQVIENIRKIRFGKGLDINSISEDVLAHIEDNKKFKEDAARLASDIHTEKPNFILELVQNAEDNVYNENVKPMVKFINQGDKLILQNNEIGFTEKNVWALCGIGQTTKQKKKMGYIGEKGIGFKSVFMVTNEPYIYSNGFQFKFKYDENDPISIIIPQWVDDVPDYVDPKQTNIVLPLKDEVKDKLIDFTNINPSLLLFLRKLQCIEIEDKIQNKSWIIKRDISNGKVTISHPGGQDYWRIVKSPEPLKVPTDVNEEKRKDVTETEMVLAFPLNQDGSADTSREQKVFVYLPVRSYGFKFIIQADFLMPPSREYINEDDSPNSWNKWLRDNIPSIFLRAVEEFKQDEKLKKTYYNYIPLANEITDAFFSPVVNQIKNNLSEAQCILTKSNNWLKPRDVFRADKNIIALIPNDDLKNFFGKEYISPDIEAKVPILDTLQVPTFGFRELVQCLQKEEWVKKQSDEWFTMLYVYLSNQELEEEEMKELRDLKILRLESNELASASEGDIFFPFDKIGNYGFETELRVVKRTLINAKETEIKDAVVKFLKNLGVYEAQPYKIIKNHILPIYESNDKNNWKSKGSKILLGYIRYIKDNLDDYEKENNTLLNKDKKPWERKEDPLGRLKKSLYIRINKTVDGSNYYALPQNIYLPKIYGNKNNLEALFEGIENIFFVHREYIDDIIKKYRQSKRKDKKSKVGIKEKREAEVKKWKDFFLKLGVNDGLKVEKTNESYLTWEDKRVLRNGSNYTREEVTDYKLIPLEQILKGIDQKKAKLLAGLLETQWGGLANYTQLEYKWFYRTWHGPNHTDSTWLHLLKITAWLPTSKGNFAEPSEVFLDKPEIKELLADTVPYLTVDIKNEKFINALEINSEANVVIVLNYLKSLTQKCEDKTIFTKFYEFLNKNYENYKYIIDQAFTSSRIIYLPGTVQRYFTSQEVLWNDISDIFGENRGYLEKHYQGLKSFFVEKLRVSEKPKPEDYSKVLIFLSQKEKVEKEDEMIILNIYKELNNHLNSANNEHLISEEKWWNDFISKPIFWTDKGEFWKNDKDVFVNDNDKLYNLFKDNPKIAFLKLPKNYHPQIQYFIEAANLSYLSESVKMELVSKEMGKIEPDLTKQVKNSVQYILQYLYQLAHSDYERLKNNKDIRSQLKNLACYSLERLEVKYSINSEFVTAKRGSLLYNGNLYIQKDQLENTDDLAINLSKLFGDIRGFEDFLISLFDKKTDEKIKNLLRAKGIQELPEEEKKQFGIADADRRMAEEKEKKEIIIEEKPSAYHPYETFSKMPSVASKKLEIGERIEWQPEYTPDEVETHFEEVQFIEKPENAPDKEKKQISISLEPLKHPKEVEKDVLSQKDKVKIGEWGEKYALIYLRKTLSAKYPKGKMEETSDGFTIRFDELFVEVHWLNVSDKGEGYVSDKGEGCDIIVVENNNIDKYIEVKSTMTNTKDWFEVSDRQWKLMKQEEDKFHIYRVYNAGTKEAKLIDIPNPYKNWKEGNLDAYPIRIQI